MPDTSHESETNHMGITIPFQAINASTGGSISGAAAPTPPPMKLEIKLPPKS